MYFKYTSHVILMMVRSNTLSPLWQDLFHFLWGSADPPPHVHTPKLTPLTSYRRKKTNVSLTHVCNCKRLATADSRYDTYNSSCRMCRRILGNILRCESCIRSQVDRRWYLARNVIRMCILIFYHLVDSEKTTTTDCKAGRTCKIKLT